MANNSSENTLISYDPTMSPGIGLSLITVAAIPVVINITVIIVCINNLRKIYYNLLVLSLCITDIFISVSSSMVSLSRLFSVLDRIRTLCLLSFIFLFFGLIGTYVQILLICLEKYLRVKSLKFGTGQKVDKKKYTIICGAFATSFSLSICITVFVPCNDRIQTCTLAVLYGEYFIIFALLIALVCTILVLLIAVLSFLTSFHIWKIVFSKNKITSFTEPRAKIADVTSTEEVGTDKQSWNGGKQRDTLTPKVRKNSVIQWETDVKKFINIKEGSTDRDTQHGSTTMAVFMNAKQQCTSKETAVSNIGKNEELEEEIKAAQTGNENEEPETVKLSGGTKICMASNIAYSNHNQDDDTDEIHIEEMAVNSHDDGPSNEYTDKRQYMATKGNKMSWEVRAFVTNIIVATTTIVLTGPLIASFWYEVFTSSLVSSKTRYLIFILYLVNSLVSPFIYVWRIPEIREAFRRCFKRSN